MPKNSPLLPLKFTIPLKMGEAVSGVGGFVSFEVGCIDSIKKSPCNFCKLTLLENKNNLYD